MRLAAAKKCHRNSTMNYAPGLFDLGAAGWGRSGAGKEAFSTDGGRIKSEHKDRSDAEAGAPPTSSDSGTSLMTGIIYDACLLATAFVAGLVSEVTKVQDDMQHLIRLKRWLRHQDKITKK